MNATPGKFNIPSNKLWLHLISADDPTRIEIPCRCRFGEEGNIAKLITCNRVCMYCPDEYVNTLWKLKTVPQGIVSNNHLPSKLYRQESHHQPFQHSRMLHWPYQQVHRAWYWLFNAFHSCAHDLDSSCWNCCVITSLWCLIKLEFVVTKIIL